MSSYGGAGSGFALLVVLFILLVIIDAPVTAAIWLLITIKKVFL